MFALFLSIVLVCVRLAVLAQRQGRRDEADDAQKKEIQSVVKFVDDAAAGQPAPNDLALTWVREDLLKAQGNKEYVPFTVTLDPTKSPATGWRSTGASSRRTPAPPGDRHRLRARRKKTRRTTRKTTRTKKPDYAYEDVTFVPIAGADGPMRISRSFTVPAGDYDVYVVAKEPTPEKPPKNAPPPKMSLIKQTRAPCRTSGTAS